MASPRNLLRVRESESERRGECLVRDLSSGGDGWKPSETNNGILKIHIGCTKGITSAYLGESRAGGWRARVGTT